MSYICKRLLEFIEDYDKDNKLSLMRVIFAVVYIAGAYMGIWLGWNGYATASAALLGTQATAIAGAYWANNLRRN